MAENSPIDSPAIILYPILTMSIRLKSFLIIAVVVAVIAASGVAVGILSAQNQILKTLEVDMKLAASLSNEYLSRESDRLKTNAATVAQVIKNTQMRELQQVLVEQVAAYEQFQAITIFNPAGKVDVSYGIAPAAEEIALGEYGQRAYEGQRVISSSYVDALGNLVFYVLVPLDEYPFQVGDEQDTLPRIVVCTVPGLLFSEQLNSFLIWDNGNISMQDRAGTIIANVHTEWVMERLNFLEIAEQDHRYKGAAEAVRRMTEGRSGTARFALENVDALITYMPAGAAEQGWSLAVIAPVKESPYYHVWVTVVIAGIIFLCLGLIAAALGSGIIARLFQQRK